MLIELYIFFTVIMVGFFVMSFFIKHEILWAITMMLSGFLMMVSWNVEYYVYQFNTTMTAYYPIATNHSYPYLFALDMMFFVLALVLFLFDVFMKYSPKYAKEGQEEGKIR